MQHCRSPFCITVDGLKGRLFTPSGEGLGKDWCGQCIKTATELQFFTDQTVNMIKNKLSAYEDTNLPKQVATFLRLYTAEIIKELGGSLEEKL